MDVARDDQEMLVVTENGFGKRTPVSEYRKTSRGAKGVQTIKFSEKRGGLAAALVVRPHQELVFISQEGMVQRTSVRGIRQTGRAAQGVTLMNVRDEDRVSAVALVVESDGATAATVTDADVAAGPVELSADSGESEGVVGGADLTDGDEEVGEFPDGAAGRRGGDGRGRGGGGEVAECADGAAGGEGAEGRGPDGNGRDPDADIG